MPGDLLPHDVTLRDYTPSDFDACLAIFDSNVPEYFLPADRDDYATFIACDRNRPYYVLESPAGLVVACGGFILSNNGQAAWLCWGMVDRAYHRRGLGRALLLARLERLRQVGSVERVLIETSQQARGFFERHGFTVRRLSANGHAPGQRKLNMTLDLNPAGYHSLAGQPSK